MAFCDKVNAEPEGPLYALKLIVPKMRHENERVSLLALAVLEACVKNCGQIFHQELGKFRFLNEVIKMLSPKYLSEQTSEAVKAKIRQLLGSWKAGLPQETKIAEAFEMLKKEGLISDEEDGDASQATLDIKQPKPKVALIEDPKQSQILQRLLSSKNPDDLRAANRLIRDMVRRDEKRMDKLKKRLDELDTIQNNIRLLTELLAHYKPDSGDGEKALMQELYSSLENKKTELFKMASEIKQNEEGMTEILQTNDDLIRVIDAYKKALGIETSPTTSSAVATGVVGAGTPAAQGEAAQTGGEATGTDPSADILIDLAGLNLGPSPNTSGQSETEGNISDELLLAELGIFGGGLSLPTTTPKPAQNMSSVPLLPPPASAQLPFSAGAPTSALPFITIPPPSHGYPIIPGVPMPNTMIVGGGLGMGPGSLGMGPPMGTGFGMMSSPIRPGFGMTSPMGGGLSATGPAIPAPNFGMAGGLNFGTGLGLSGTTSVPSQAVASTGMPVATPVQGVALPPTGGPDPLAILNDLVVPLESIQQGSLPPVSVMNKDSITVTLHFAKNVPKPGVLVAVISVISTNVSPVTGVEFQAAVPKVMRVKLQPPSGTTLAAFNPILPPPMISQVLLLANPSKTKIRMKYKMSYKLGGQEMVDTGELSNFPQF
eukprot:Em0020g883a